MKNVMALRKAGYLTEQQVLTALRFKRNPLEFKLAPTLFRTCFDLIVQEIPLETFEKKRGWAARSAKVVLSELLFALEEVQGMWWGSDKDLDDNEVKYLLGEVDQEAANLVGRYGFSSQEARLFLILSRAENIVLSKDTLTNRLYYNRPSDSIPDAKIIDSFIFKIRKKISSLGWEIVTVRGEGYSAKRKLSVDNGKR